LKGLVRMMSRARFAILIANIVLLATLILIAQSHP
jgi:hypothetical protein